MNACPFCSIPQENIVLEQGPCIAVYDRYPVSRGHALIIPRRHTASFRNLTEAEWQAVLPLAARLAAQLAQDDSSIEGFNLGINDGEVAGQTIFHVHIHLIPRRRGDVPQPAGGVRWLFPEKAVYPMNTHRGSWDTRTP